MKKWMYVVAIVPPAVCLLACVARYLHMPVWNDSLGRVLLLASPIAYVLMIVSIGLVARTEHAPIPRILLIILNGVAILPCSWAMFFGCIMWWGFTQT